MGTHNEALVVVRRTEIVDLNPDPPPLSVKHP